MRQSDASYLTSTQVADLLHVSAATVKRWADDGWLPFTRTRGGHRRFRRDDVEQASLRMDRPENGVPGAGAWLTRQLMAREDVLSIQGELLATRARLGSWAALREPCMRTLRALGEQGIAASRLSVRTAHAVLDAALGRCADELPVRPGTPSALLATMDGGSSSVELTLLRLCVREAGWTAWSVGAVTAEEIAAFASSARTDVIMLVGSLGQRCGDLDEAIALVAQACERAGVPLALTGEGWPETTAPARRVTSAAELSTWLAEVEREPEARRQA
jgi:excisionase family DNA binding protein